MKFETLFFLEFKDWVQSARDVFTKEPDFIIFSPYKYLSEPQFFSSNDNRETLIIFSVGKLWKKS